MRPLERPDGAEIDVKHVFVEKDKGVEGLILRGGRHVALGGQVVEKRANVSSAQGAWMHDLVESHKALDPSAVGFLRVIAVAPSLAGHTDPVEQLRRTSR